MASKVLISMFIFVYFVFFCHFCQLTDAFCKVICTSYLLEVDFIQIALKYTLLFGFFCVSFVKKCQKCLLPDAFCKFICASYFLEVVFIRIARWFIFFKHTIRLCTFHLQTVEQ